jgi:ribosomal protein S18 acetylase RimI-like enzyme
MKPLCIRSLQPADLPRIEEIVTAAGNFNPAEIATAMELVNEAIAKGEASGYEIIVAERQGSASGVEGYACYGATPLTEGVYDLYWIAVHPQAQRRGAGGALMRHVEEDVQRRGGRMLMIETSSREGYEATIGFYRGIDYTLQARIKNFYHVGDDKLIFSKEFPQSERT